MWLRWRIQAWCRIIAEYAWPVGLVMVSVSRATSSVNVSALSDRLSIFETRQEPEMACAGRALALAHTNHDALAGNRIAAGVPIICKFKCGRCSRQGDTTILETATTLPFFLSVSSMLLSSTTLTLMTGNAGLAPINSILQQENVGFRGRD
jgi:hypothetical protein